MKKTSKKKVEVEHIELSVEEKCKLLREALVAAKDHLEYCGYGDNWERECAEAQGLEKKIEAALEETK